MNEPGQIKLVAVDVDGTLLNSKSELTQRTEAVLRKAVAQGVQIVLATGKTRHSTAHVIEKLNLNTHGIYLQGLAIYTGDGSIHWQQTLDPRLARQVITFAEDRGFTIIAYSGMRILVRSMNDIVKNALVKYHEPLPEAVGPLQNVLNDTPIHKLMVLGEPRAVKSLRWQLNLQLGSAGRVVQAGLPNMLEVLPPNASKGAALKMLLRDLRISPENVLAAGDAENDIEMIQLAGVGIAMGQAVQKVKDAADQVVASNDEDGFAEAIERFVLPHESSATDTSNSTPTPTEAKPVSPQPTQSQSKATETTP
jgi:Cof subfamily protein (haloacid dehalogenase superfamily)